MANAAGLILSAFSVGLSLIGQIQDSVSSSDAAQASTTLSFACAQTNPDDTGSVDGKFDVRLYNAYSELVGPPVVDKYINNGNSGLKFTYNHDAAHDGQEAQYIKVTGNNDAVCLAWFTVTWPRGTDWAWTGDHGRWCGALPWHYNANYFGTKHNDDGSTQPFQPVCSWIDGDGSVGGDTTAYSVFLPHFTGENDGSSGSKSQLCSSPNFALYNNDDGGGLAYFSPPPGVTNLNNYDGRKREADTSKANGSYQAMENQLEPTARIPQRLFTKNNVKLIISAHPEHTASDLCESDTSWGPSLVSTVENKMCDMSTKTLYDTCDTRTGLLNSLCFDMETLGLKGLKIASSFNWKKVEEWGPQIDQPLQWIIVD